MSNWRENLIEDSGLSTRAKNSLRRGGYYRMGEVVAATPYELLRIPELGRKTMKEIEAHFAKIGASAGDDRQRIIWQIRNMEQRRERVAEELADIDRNLAHAKGRIA